MVNALAVASSQKGAVNVAKTIDPLGQLVAALANGATPKQLRSLLQKSNGLQSLLGPSEIDFESDRPDAPNELARLQATYKQRLRNDPTAARSAIRVHKGEAGWIAAAQRVICTPEWVMQPRKGRVICANRADAERIEALLRQPTPDSPEDPLEAAYWLVEVFYQPNSVVERLAPTLLVSEVQGGDQLQEAFLSPACWGLLPEQLLPVARATVVGLHLIRGGDD